MNLPIMIFQRLLGCATAGQVAALSAKVEAIQTTGEAIQQGQNDIKAKLDQILDLLTLPPAESIEFDVVIYREDGQGVESERRGTHTMKMSDSQRAQLTIRPVDRRQKPASLDGAPAWATSDPTVATVTPGLLNPDGSIGPDPDPQGLNAVLEGVARGTCRVTVTGDANLSATETAPITGVLDVEITAGQAISVNIDAGSPVEIP